MKERKDKSGVPILAAGGIVLRNDRTPQFAIVQLRKMGAWGLPKGKLAGGENAMAAARREVLEETGHRVTIHEFLGTLAYEASGRPKVVQFWRMHAVGGPVGDLTHDVKAVDWLALEHAIERLTHLRERVFLEQVGPIALKFAELSARRAALRGQLGAEDLVRRALSDPRMRTIGKVVPLAPAPDGNPTLACPSPHAAESAEEAEPIEPEPLRQRRAADVLAPPQPPWRTGQDERTEAGAAAGLIGKTWAWFRHATLPHRQPLD